MEFDREKHAVVPARDFDHGVVSGKKGEALNDAQLADLSDQAVAHLVEIAEVAEIVDKSKVAKAAKSDGAGDGDKGSAPQSGGKS